MEWNSWDIAILTLAAFVAATVLVRLMIARRDQLLDELSQDTQRQKKVNKQP